jgi:hypothetical protein
MKNEKTKKKYYMRENNEKDLKDTGRSRNMSKKNCAEIDQYKKVYHM